MFYWKNEQQTMTLWVIVLLASVFPSMLQVRENDIAVYDYCSWMVHANVRENDIVVYDYCSWMVHAILYCRLAVISLSNKCESWAERMLVWISKECKWILFDLVNQTSTYLWSLLSWLDILEPYCSPWNACKHQQSWTNPWVS